MSIMDYRDKLDAERAVRQARSHGDSNSIMAFKDRMDARKLVNQYNKTEENLSPNGKKVAGRAVEDRIIYSD
jgi:hypothetical protein